MTTTHAMLFYVNGNRFEIADPDPTTLLIDWLRSDAIGFTGTKLSCGEGGCGACTVMLSRWVPEERRVVETAINSCLRPRFLRRAQCRASAHSSSSTAA